MPETAFLRTLDRIQNPAPGQLLQQPQAAQPSRLLALPNELLLQILTHAGSVDRMLLALTCKRLLAVSFMTVTMIPSASRHHAYQLNCRAMLDLVHAVRPLDARGRRRVSWAPCCVCYRWRPRRKAFWNFIPKQYATEIAAGIMDDYDYIIQRWGKSRSAMYQCPSCWCDERISLYGHLVDRKMKGGKRG
ncbi:uncharacterized protein UV8b_05255 [Ustilaginoidea virens]|uniref:F-box domain-containing protein n=1 Tax=Ustilaginoidea virens TaxID=1159556 RepID=A0A8E5HTN2_USTVR|nr:uncharacterized protein UV8b_05255 [Ustilaginoidea virens]QUC21014.1 hypothetical protein UV8b_05255 [Ustilaginoidea virens]